MIPNTSKALRPFQWEVVICSDTFQFHTPFMKGDPLWLEFGKLRNEMVDKLIDLRRKYSWFVINNEKQLSFMKGYAGDYEILNIS
jgi:Fe-coproporphyrin III synthase